MPTEIVGCSNLRLAHIARNNAMRAAQHHGMTTSDKIAFAKRIDAVHLEFWAKVRLKQLEKAEPEGQPKNFSKAVTSVSAPHQ
ncbi:hypothetical protein ACQYRI_00670 [Salmonella enterica]